MKLKYAIWAALAGLMPLSANALALEFPAGAVQTAKTIEPMGNYAVPVGVFTGGSVPVLSTKGSVVSEAWRIDAGAVSTVQLIDQLAEQLKTAGFEILMECATEQCGGFDFRYQLDLLPEPEMHVDLGDFQYLTARRTLSDDTPEIITLIVSRGGQSAFVQVTHIGPPEIETNTIVTSSMSPDAAALPGDLPKDSLASMLTTIGRAPLEDLSFATGSAELGNEGFGSLAELAAWLKSNPDKTVALVGHTDAEGSLASNMALSKKRAASVMNRLVSEFGVPRSQLEAAGVGYLVPRASNLTKDGRDLNRRVEVILTATR